MPGLSISLWARPNVQSDSDYNGIFMTRGEGIDDLNYGIAFENNNRNFDYRASGAQIDSAINSVIVPGAEADPLDGWYHPVVTMDLDSQTQIAYINDELIDSKFANGVADLDGEGYRIGSNGATLGNLRDFDGLIDDITIFDRPISISTTKALYGAGLESQSAVEVLNFAIPAPAERPQISSVSIAGDGVVLGFPAPVSLNLINPAALQKWSFRCFFVRKCEANRFRYE